MVALGVPIYLSVAIALREQIEHGIYQPGQELPAEQALAHDFHCGRDTIRAAIKVLSDEALISTRRGSPAFVRPRIERRALILQPGEKLIGRMPSHLERAHLDLDVGVPVLEVQRADGSSKLFAANQVTVLTSAS